MEYKDYMNDLTPKDKVELAVRLTQAAMGVVSFPLPATTQATLQAQSEGAVDITLMVFRDFIDYLDSGKTPSPNHSQHQ